MTFVWGIILYAKHSAKQRITQKSLDEVFLKINAVPELPESFKDTYKKVNPDVFKTNYNSCFLKTIFGFDKIVYPPSKEVAHHCYALFSGAKSRFQSKMNYLGFVYILEENVSQEKCFEYAMSRFDFLNNQKGINNAARFYYKKPLDSLNLNEQLGLIVFLENPSLYNLNRGKWIKKVEALRIQLDI